MSYMQKLTQLRGVLNATRRNKVASRPLYVGGIFSIFDFFWK
jgi:hypothetical protein